MNFFHRKEWGWNHNIGLSELVEIMITNLKKVQNTIREAIKKSINKEKFFISLDPLPPPPPPK